MISASNIDRTAHKTVILVVDLGVRDGDLTRGADIECIGVVATSGVTGAVVNGNRVLRHVRIIAETIKSPVSVPAGDLLRS